MKTIALSSLATVVIALCTALPALAEEDATALFERGVALVDPYITLSGKSEADPKSVQGHQAIARGTALLEQVTQMRPDSWQSYWFIGKARQAVGDSAAAYDAMKQAYALQPDQRDVAREFVFEALCTSRFGEAVAAARRVSAAHPDDAGLSANLAVALLADRQLDSAERETARALRLAPNDPITRNLSHAIADARNGKPPPNFCAQ
jgi:Flp pilus assembly protein TadD